MLRADILGLATVPQNAHEKAFINFTPGAFAPACGAQDELRSNGGVYGTAIRRRGIRLTMFPVFLAWLAGYTPAILASESPTDSVCP